MNAQILELARRAGFVVFEDGIDWSNNYDDALVSFYELVLNEAYETEFGDNLDGDHASALSSAGWGTDEDYRF